MKRYAVMLLVALGLSSVLMTGCEWTAGNSVDSWNSRYNSLNFSAVYVGAANGPLITAYSADAGYSGFTNQVFGEVLAAGDSVRKVFSGNLQHTPISTKTLMISAGTYILMDNDGSGLLDSNLANATGRVVYATGSWEVTLPTAPAVGTTITANYSYYAAGLSGRTNTVSGVSGATIYNFTVQQEGENLTIIDNNGRNYTGKMGSIRTAGGGDVTAPDSAGVTGEVMAQFEVHGVSAAGYEVTMVGNFSGTAGTGTLTTRRMIGTWTETGGVTGNIYGAEQ